ncbi:hypothetical protein CPT_Muldoon_101 [Serratia phage Muldoon]|uniref:Uncharacterized protein n=1 Tax=Serratia phage Muldoon TaxID=2601678 RepID=A0A5P8PH92_9CAUD|nr:hypothetical protein HYP94_gp100 [Serratia phage Muldoon]QFR56056.1 hypothetical protein CPT_Muldoon_101 [Serratia phage Muldoon]
MITEEMQLSWWKKKVHQRKVALMLKYGSVPTKKDKK